MCHPVMVCVEVALAVTVTGALTVAPAAGLVTFTCTPCTPTLMLAVWAQTSPCESVAFTVTIWLPEVMVNDWFTEAVVVVKTAVPSTSISIETMEAPPGGLADAVTCTGEVTVALLTGLVIVTKQALPVTLYWMGPDM